MVRGLPSAKRRGKGRAGAGSTHAAPLFSSWLVHPPEQPTAARPDTHISISRAPASTCPSSPTSSFTNLCLPPGWLMFGTTVPPCLRKCWQEQCQISPNEPYLCQRLRKEFRLEFLLPSCQVLACHTAPPHLLPSACQPGGHLQGRAASLGAQGMGKARCIPVRSGHGQEGPGHGVPRSGTVGSRRWVACTAPFLPPTTQERITSQ